MKSYIAVGQVWVAKPGPKKLKVLEAGTGYPHKYCHKVSIYVPKLIEKTEWVPDGTILTNYTLLDLKDKIDALLSSP